LAGPRWALIAVQTGLPTQVAKIVDNLLTTHPAPGKPRSSGVHKACQEQRQSRRRFSLLLVKTLWTR
jgi:hypothetical protein